MDKRTSEILTGHPTALLVALHTAMYSLSAQRTRLYHLLALTSLTGHLIHTDPTVERRYVESREDLSPEGLRKAHRYASTAVIQMGFCREVETLISFFRDAAAIGILLKPEVLRSKTRNMTLDEVLGFESMDDLLVHLALRRTDELAHDDFGLLAYCADDLGMPVFTDSDHRKQMKKAIRMRAVFVHNGGQIDQRYLLATKEDPSLLDEHLSIDEAELREWVECFDDCSKRIYDHVLEAWHAKHPDEPRHPHLLVDAT